MFAAAANAQLVEDTAIPCDYCEQWNAPQAPFRIFGNTWYVGTAGLSAILVVTDEGLILLDGALPQSASLIDASIRELGFDTTSIEYLLNSHAHYDHAGGMNSLQRHSGAEVVASHRSRRVLEKGKLADDDPQFAIGHAATGFPPVKNVRPIGDGGVVELGGVVLTAHYTPGHTPGATSWTWQSCEEDRCLNIVYADSLSAVSADGFHFTNGGSLAGAGEALQNSIDTIRQLPCDILLSPHPGFFQMSEKWQAMQGELDGNPFIGNSECREYADYFSQWLQRRVDEEIRER